jgi:uncharacterized membrane protein HdeD (DUF308 family)
MSKINAKTLEAKLKSINKGSFWFGIIGRVSLITGAILFISGLAGVIMQQDVAGIENRMLISSLPYLINGWLFLLGRDAFDAIAHLIKEMEEII